MTSSLKKKAREYDETRQEAVPLIKRRMFNSELRDIEKEMDVFLETEAQLRSREAELRPFVKKYSALQIQGAMRNKIARNTVKQTRITKNTAATKIQKTIRGNTARNEIIKNLEDQVGKVENMISSTRSNLNEQRPEGLRKAKKALMDRRSELVTRSKNMNREQKKAEFIELNTAEQHYDNVINNKKPGPKTGKK